MERLDRFLGALEYFFELLLFLVHFLFVLLSFSLNFFQSLPNHIINISGFFVDDPSILNLFGFEFVLILFKQSVNLCIFDNFSFYFLDLKCSGSIKKILKFTCLFDCRCIFLYLVLDLLELLQLLNCRLNNSVGYDLL